MRRLAVTAVLVLALCPVLGAQDTKQLIAAIKELNGSPDPPPRLLTAESAQVSTGRAVQLL